MNLGGKDTTFFTYGNRMYKKKVGLTYKSRAVIIWQPYFINRIKISYYSNERIAFLISSIASRSSSSLITNGGAKRMMC